MKKNKGTIYVLPAFITLGIITLYPTLYVFWLSLHKKIPTLNISEYIGAENFLFLTSDSRLFSALINTLYFTVVSISLELIIGISMAILINRTFFAKGAVRSIFLVPWAIPTVVSAKMWEWIYNYDAGILNYLLGEKINWLGKPAIAMNAAIFMDVWKTTPFVILLITAGLQTIPKDLYHAAAIDGAGTWQKFYKITLPLLKPTILVVLLFRTIDAARVFDAIYVLTGGGPANATETLSIYAYKIIFQTLQFGYGSAVSVIIFLCIGMISLLYIKILTRENKS